MTDAFYQYEGERDGAELFSATAHTSGPWDARSQHGGPPAALLGRACERLASSTGEGRSVSRFSMDLLGPVPVGRLTVRATILRPGRSVDLCHAELVDDSTGRVAARAHAWRSRTRTDGPDNSEPTSLAAPHEGTERPFPDSWWQDGYLRAVQWSWLRGSVAEPGPVVVWMRPLIPLLAGESLTPLQRLLACVDSASGVSAELDAQEWGFLNTELTVHLTRPVDGEWVCLDAQTHLGGGSAGLARATLYDEGGLVGASAQSLLIAERS